MEDKTEQEESGEVVITEKDVKHALWIQEIKDKVIVPMGSDMSFNSLISFWDFCEVIQSFVKEKVKEEKEKIAHDIKKWDVEACCHGIRQRDLVKYLTGEIID